MTEVKNALRYALYVTVHPFDGFWDLKNEKRGNLRVAFILLALTVFTYVAQRRYTGFVFNYNHIVKLNVLMEILSVLLLFFLWVSANWCLTTLMDGKGTYRDIVIATAYSLTPYILINLVLIILSHFFISGEGVFYYFFITVSFIWSGALLFLSTMITHDYLFWKSFFTVILILVGMGIMIFLLLLLASVVQQIIGLGFSIYKELSFRL